MLDIYRKMDNKDLKNEPIIGIYEELFTGVRKGLPKGTWQNDQYVILIIRYAFEVKLKLNKVGIPKITKQTIKEQKLWGALNRFKSIKKLLQLVYPGAFDVFSFYRVSVDYWSNIENIKSRFEDMLQKNNISFYDIPKFITYDLLIKWGLSNPLKRHKDSPFQLINEMYPGVFKPYQFRKIPQRHARNKEILKEQFFAMLKEEQIALHEIPQKVTQEILYRYRFNGAMSYYKQSPSKFIMALFPNEFTQKDFIRPQGYWHDIEAAKSAIFRLIEKLAIPFAEIPQHLTKKMFAEHGLGGLLDQYDGSPINIVQACFPGEFDIFEFKRVPNRFWYDRENRIEALRSYCRKHLVEIEELPMLSRAYFKSKYPRFVSVVDRHFESKIHLWIMEAFPEHEFTPSDFNLLVGDDGQLCDSHEELLVHNALLRIFKDARITREGKRFTNREYNESYLPDWLIELDGKEILVEYFGLYGSSRFPGYNEKANRKIAFYRSLDDFEFVMLLPEDLNRIDSVLNDQLGESGDIGISIQQL
ncbi:hypothetical protein [Oceanobacillus damuensis]|uniref:hypothetical protein n=1 Tax=Oceanobacillus damuensis TaxID=937928 RepID=UPI0008374EEC|nr:hypothetical protein [Oceanobacillus damuensis]